MPRTLEKETDENNSEKSEADKQTEKRWTWIIAVLCLAFAVTTIVIVVIALEPSSSSIPGDIDVVLYQSPQTSRMSRYIMQSKAVWKYMPWVRRIFVLSQYANPGFDPTMDVQVVSFTGTESEAFEYMPLIPEISTHALFLSDRTFPFRAVKKRYMFYKTRPRMFNAFREQSEVNFLTDMFELPTMPVLTTDLGKLSEAPGTWQALLYREMTEERVVLREDMNRDVFVYSVIQNNIQKQFDKIVSAPPLFATFHINAEDPNPVSANNLLSTFLVQQFP